MSKKDYTKEYSEWWKTFKDRDGNAYPSNEDIILWWRNRIAIERHDLFYDLKKVLEEHAIYNISPSPQYSDGVRDSIKLLIETYKETTWLEK